MAEFAVKVVRIVEPVVDHPDADRLSIVRVNGYEAIANKLEDGSPRYKVGDLIVYVPEMAMLPEWLLKQQGMWKDEEGKGMLNGPLGNRVKAIKLRGIVSQGVMVPVVNDGIRVPIIVDGEWVGGIGYNVAEDDDVAEMLGITKYEPVIPVALAGEVCNIAGKTIKYDFENLKSVPGIFEVGERVIATEKLHGTFLAAALIPGFGHPELFADGDVYVGSKGLSSQGLVFKDNAENDDNLYVKVLQEILTRPTFLTNLREYSAANQNSTVHIFGEVYGANVQKKYGYGLKSPELRIFDIAVDGYYLAHDRLVQVAAFLGLEMVPILYDGPFNIDALTVFRDGNEPGVKVPGKDALTGTTTREGIVVRAKDGSFHPKYRRKIAKMINPTYLLKTDGEEFN